MGGWRWRRCAAARPGAQVLHNRPSPRTLQPRAPFAQLVELEKAGTVLVEHSESGVDQFAVGSIEGGRVCGNRRAHAGGRGTLLKTRTRVPTRKSDTVRPEMLL